MRFIRAIDPAPQLALDNAWSILRLLRYVRELFFEGQRAQIFKVRLYPFANASSLATKCSGILCERGITRRITIQERQQPNLFAERAQLPCDLEGDRAAE